MCSVWSAVMYWKGIKNMFKKLKDTIDSSGGNHKIKAKGWTEW